jgi:hypothetical protein
MKCATSQTKLASLLHIRYWTPDPRATVSNAMTTSWQPTTLVQCVSLKPWLSYPGCDESGGCHDLTLGRIYEMLGVEAKGSFYRILDDSGDDFLYPASHFKVV